MINNLLLNSKVMKEYHNKDNKDRE